MLDSKTLKDGVVRKRGELTVGFLAFRESYISEVTCVPYESGEVDNTPGKASDIRRVCRPLIEVERGVLLGGGIGNDQRSVGEKGLTDTGVATSGVKGAPDSATRSGTVNT